MNGKQKAVAVKIIDLVKEKEFELKNEEKRAKLELLENKESLKRDKRDYLTDIEREIEITKNYVHPNLLHCIHFEKN